MSTINTEKLTNRYPGVKPFSADEQLLFFGRANDLEALNSIIFIKQLIVLYGKSGYGKSSLINAGIIPRLKQNESWIYFSIRFNNFSEKEINQNLSPAQTVKQRLANNITLDESTDFYKLIPDENSFWYWIKQNQLSNKKSKIILFFDQFEELFTYPKEQVSEFSEQLSQLLYTTVPSRYKKKLAELDEQDAVSDELHSFIYEKPEIKVVFAIRSDRLSLMNILTDRHPSILQNYYELDALNVKDAAAAITEPAKLSEELSFKTPSFEFSQSAVDKILNGIANVQDGKIEAATLQIVCRHVEDNLVFEKKYTIITEEILGDITDIFQQYYEAILNKLPAEERAKAQHLIEDELIEGGRRNTLTDRSILNRLGVSKNLLEQLEQSSLLRKERDANGRLLYEVSHDTLIAAINKVAEARRVEENKAAEARRIEEEEIKRKSLEQQIKDERKRADDLQELKDKAVFRFRLAISMTVVAVIIAVAAIMATVWAIKNKEAVEKAQTVAVANQKRADSARKNADKAYYNLQKITTTSKVNEIMRAGDRLKQLGDKKTACKRYDSAFNFIKQYKTDSLYLELQKRINECQ